MNWHYSLFHCQNREGNPILIDLSKITHIAVDEAENLHVVFLSDRDWVHLCNVDGDLLVEAWNIYKHATSAATFIKRHPVCNDKSLINALNIDAQLAIEAGKILKELKEMGGEG